MSAIFGPEYPKKALNLLVKESGNMPLQMRQATEGDLGSIARISAAAFHPSTDSITRRLFPGGCDSARAWREARKTISLESERTLMMVVEDSEADGRIVGFSFWEIPIAHVGAKPQQQSREPDAPAELDQDAFREMKAIVTGDAADAFGQEGTSRIWRMF
jgi:hypothetical protein